MNIRQAVETEAQLLSALAMRAKAYWGYSERSSEPGERVGRVATGIRAGPLSSAIVGIEGRGFTLFLRRVVVRSSTISGSAAVHSPGRWAARFFRMPSNSGLRWAPAEVTVDATRMRSRSILSAGGASRRVPAPLPGQPQRARPQLTFDARTS